MGLPLSEHNLVYFLSAFFLGCHSPLFAPSFCPPLPSILSSPLPLLPLNQRSVSHYPLQSALCLSQEMKNLNKHTHPAPPPLFSVLLPPLVLTIIRGLVYWCVTAWGPVPLSVILLGLCGQAFGSWTDLMMLQCD